MEEGMRMKVYYGTNFWGHPKEGQAPMEELPIRQEFTWGELSGFIPAIYVSEEGLAIDFCIRIPNEKVQAFLDKWGDKLTGDISDEEQEQISRENPLDIAFNVKLYLNGQELENAFGCGASYSKVIAREYERRYQKTFPKNSKEQQLMQEYGCEDSLSWCFKRHMCKWEHRPEVLDCLEIEFIAGRKEYFGEALEIGVEDVNQTYEIQSPVDGNTYQLHICEVEQKELNPEIFNMHGDLRGRRKHAKENNLEKFAERIAEQGTIEYPCHYLALSCEMLAAASFGVGESLSYEQFRLKDSSKGNKARRLRQYQASEVNVIVGAVDGPTSVFIAGRKKDMEKQLAVSSMYFDPIDRVSWVPVFLEKEREDMRLEVFFHK